MALSEYEIRETIATSARSVVRRAVRRKDGESVILKSLAQDFASVQELRQLEFEYRILRKLEVPGVIQALAFEKNGSEAALVLEDFGGENLALGGAGLELALFLDVALQAARALGRVHECNVIHKDIKPRNLLVNPRTLEVKLVDFHVASELSRERLDLSVAGQLLGSLPYISPEQTGRMNRELDYRTDYYSLGVTLFELLTGRLPFEASDAMGWVHCHISKRPPHASSFRPDAPLVVSEIIAKLMAKDPDERYQSSHGLISDLSRCQTEWKATGGIEPFALGSADVSERFQVSQKLFGRERERGLLLEVFESASRGNASLLLVSGYSGIGKSSLIHEIHKPITQRNGYFADGKFDQLERNVPYAAFVRALRGLVKQLLAESDERLAVWKAELRDALGANGRVIVDFIPEFSQVVGPQPALAELAPREAQNRFKHVIREFLKVFAREEHPLVIFLDDLQWMDTSTPELLVDLFGNSELRHFLLIGAYRDNEIHEGHLLPMALKSIRSTRPDAIYELPLGALDETSIQRMLSETLRSLERDVEPLVHAIFERTEGNPFLTNELLISLHQAGVFAFRSTDGRWVWDLERVQQAAVSDDIADIMVQRLRRLPVETSEVLRVAACVGNRFELDTLARVLEKTPGQIASALWDAILQRIIVPLDANYRLFHGTETETPETNLGVRYQFQHDRVQQAAYSLLDAGERARAHLGIGRLLLAGIQDPEKDPGIFEVVNHLNLADSLVTEFRERSQLAQLNSFAAQRANQSAAHAIAARYCEKSTKLLTAEEWAVQPDRRFSVFRERAECVFLAGDVERAAALCDELLEFAPSKVATGSVYFLKTRIVEHQGKLLDAVATIREALKPFGITLPEDPADIDQGIAEGIEKMQAHLSRVSIEELALLPEATDPDEIMTMNLLFQVIPPAIQTYPPLFILVELLMFDRALKHGTAPVSSKNFVDCGIIQGGILGNYDFAYRLGQTAFKLLSRYVPTPLESAVHFVFGGFVSHWREHYRESFEAYAKAQRLGIESGDIQHAAYAAVHRMHRLFFVGKNLDECHAENASTVAYLERLHATGQLFGALVSLRAVARLRGKEPELAAEQADQEAARTLERAGNAQWLYSYGQAMTMSHGLLGDWAAAERWQRFTDPFAAAGVCLFSQADFVLFQALILTQTWSQLSNSEREPVLAKLQASHGQLRKWAESCPDNFAHKAHLLGAELASIQGQPIEQVLHEYECAAAATKDSFVQLRALIRELQGRFWLSKGHARLARAELREAYQLYADWGANAKLRALQKSYPAWFAGERDDGEVTQSLPKSTGGISTLDFTSVLKATQALSSEVKTDKLFRTLMHTIIENAGAEHGCLVLQNDSDQRLYVEAWASVEHSGSEAFHPILLDSAEHVCRDIVRLVQRTRETLVLGDAAHEGAFQSDPYVRKQGLRSVLCIPILNQGSLVAVLYAENNAAPHTFTQERVNILRVIASQAAISITNAKLYNQLEQKVEERTRQIAQKTREIAAMLDGMEQGVFTIDAELAIQPEYSRHLEQILGTAHIAGESCMRLLFQGANLPPDRLAAMQAALRFSFGSSPTLAEANMAHLVNEFQAVDAAGNQRFLELDWNWIVDQENRVEKVLVAVRDVTAIRQLKESFARKTRELDIVGQILDATVAEFSEFCRSARERLQENRRILEQQPELPPRTVEQLFRNLHTIKGNARLLGFGYLVDIAHQGEEPYDELRRNPNRPTERAELVAGLDAVLELLSEYEEICERKLGPLSSGRDAQLEQAVRDIEVLIDDSAGTMHADQALKRVRASLRKLRNVSLSSVVRDTSRMVPSLAKELGKLVPSVKCEDGGTVLSFECAEAVKDVLVHSFRNCLAHGIELPDEREARGKPRQGLIQITAHAKSDALSIHVADDGRGLAVDELRASIGLLDASDEAVAEAVFRSGVSSSPRVSRVSGRGVGMDVMRSSLLKHRGSLKLVFTGEPSRGYRPFELVIILPRASDPLCPDA